MLPRSFYFLRHGETDWNRTGRIQGWTDTALNATGRAQALAAAAVIEKLDIDCFIASPLKRAHETAGIVNRKLQKPLFTDVRLQERHYGVFEGALSTDFRAWQREAAACNPAGIEENGSPLPEKGEPYPVFKQRIVDALIEHLGNFSGRNVMFVAHGGVYRALQRCLSRNPEMAENAKPYHFDRTAAGWIVREV